MNPSVDSQERVAAAIGAVVFFVPYLMDKVTEFTLTYIRQGFLIFMISVLVWILMMLLPFFGSIFAFILMLLFFFSLFLAWKAWEGERFTVPYFYDWSLALIRILQLEKGFSPKK